jgi:hypothetical protein
MINVYGKIVVVIQIRLLIETASYTANKKFLSQEFAAGLLVEAPVFVTLYEWPYIEPFKSGLQSTLNRCTVRPLRVTMPDAVEIKF